MDGRLTGFSLNRDGTQNVTVTVAADFAATYDELKDGPVSVEIKMARKRRSLDSNAYAWVIIDQIAERTGVKKSEVYRNAIREIGGVSDTVCVIDRAVERLRQSWQRNGLGWQVETSESKIEGCTNVTLYYGSSVFDSGQMSRLIDSLIQDAEALGIPTITPKEQERMLQMWGRKTEGKHENAQVRENHERAISRDLKRAAEQ